MGAQRRVDGRGSRVQSQWLGSCTFFWAAKPFATPTALLLMGNDGAMGSGGLAKGALGQISKLILGGGKATGDKAGSAQRRERSAGGKAGKDVAVGGKVNAAQAAQLVATHFPGLVEGQAAFAKILEGLERPPGRVTPPSGGFAPGGLFDGVPGSNYADAPARIRDVVGNA